MSETKHGFIIPDNPPNWKRDLEQTVATLKKERDELAAHCQALRQTLQSILDCDEMGYLLDGKTHECVQCGEKKNNDDPNPVKHREECVQGWIEQTLLSTPADSLKALLSPTLELLKELRAACDEQCFYHLEERTQKEIGRLEGMAGSP